MPGLLLHVPGPEEIRIRLEKHDCSFDSGSTASHKTCPSVLAARKRQLTECLMKFGASEFPGLPIRCRTRPCDDQFRDTSAESFNLVSLPRKLVGGHHQFASVVRAVLDRRSGQATNQKFLWAAYGGFRDSLPRSRRSRTAASGRQQHVARKRHSYNFQQIPAIAQRREMIGVTPYWDMAIDRHRARAPARRARARAGVPPQQPPRSTTGIQVESAASREGAAWRRRRRAHRRQ